MFSLYSSDWLGVGWAYLEPNARLFLSDLNHNQNFCLWLLAVLKSSAKCSHGRRLIIPKKYQVKYFM